MKNKILLYSIWVFSPLAVYAQEIDRLPGVIDRQQLSKFPKKFDKYYTEPPKKTPKLDFSTTTDFSFYIKTIEVSGAYEISKRKLSKIIKSYEGRKLTGKDIAILKYKISREYFNEGYILVRVATPPQDITDNILKIQVVEGRVDDIKFYNEHLASVTARGLFARVDKGDIFDELEVESAFNDIDELQNIKSRLSLEPGKEFGTTILNVHIDKAKEDKHYIEHNNYGARNVSRDVTTLGIQRGNLLSLGETINVRFNYGYEQMYGGSFDWSSPLPGTDLFFNVSYILNNIEVGGRFRALDSEGKSQSIRSSIYRNFINTNKQRFTTVLGVEYRKHESFLSNVPETRDIVSKIRGGISYLHRWSKTIFYTHMEILRGVHAFGATKRGDSMQTRTHNPQAWIFASTIFVKHRLTEKDQLSARIRGQHATSSLLASDLFSIGGYTSLRGFEPSQESGESGFAISLEYQRNLHQANELEVNLRSFVESGVVYNKLNNSSSDQHLYSIGAGLDFNFDNGIKKFGKTECSFDFAAPVGNYRSTSHQGAYFYFNVKQSF